jgi:hypothetical protein
MCWNLFAFRKTGLDAIYLMRRRSQSPTTFGVVNYNNNEKCSTGILSDVVHCNEMQYKYHIWKYGRRSCISVVLE